MAVTSAAKSPRVTLSGWILVPFSVKSLASMRSGLSGIFVVESPWSSRWWMAERGFQTSCSVSTGWTGRRNCQSASSEDIRNPDGWSSVGNSRGQSDVLAVGGHKSASGFVGSSRASGFRWKTFRRKSPIIFRQRSISRRAVLWCRLHVHGSMGVTIARQWRTNGQGQGRTRGGGRA